MPGCRPLLIASTLLLLACAPPADDSAPEANPTVLRVEGSTLTWTGDGGVDIATTDGDEILRHAVAAVTLDATDEKGWRLATDAARTRSAEVVTDEDALGAAERLVITQQGADGEPDLRWTLSAYAEGGF
ncbi:MAG: hypothetical protein ABIO70_26210 [Pseudomonadota bacterium]